MIPPQTKPSNLPVALQVPQIAVGIVEYGLDSTMPGSEMRRQQTRLIATIVGSTLLVATGAYVFSRWISQQPVAADAASAMQQQAEDNTLDMQRRLADALATRVGSEEQQRLDSPLGQALFRKCVEWTEFQENHPSEATDAHRTTACAEFRRYVNQGVVPTLPQQQKPSA